MAYHLTGWQFAEPDSGGLLGRMGIYGVSIFFILSGLSMAIVYSNFIVGQRTSLIFFVRRIFRIWPLLWVCIGLQIMPLAVAGSGGVPIGKVVLNLTTAFGFVKPEAYINTGAWSIGNEMVYYAMTPFMLLLYRRRVAYGNSALALALAISLYFCFCLLTPQASLASQWRSYINPFNNLFLYLSGIAIYFNLKELKFKPWVVGGLFACSVGFLSLYPVTGDQITIVTGVNRLLFMLASLALVVSFYKFSQYHLVPGFISFPLEQLGIATYGVYLLHPIVCGYLGRLLGKIGFPNPYLLFSLVIVLTIAVALLSYHLFEKKMMKLGKMIGNTAG